MAKYVSPMLATLTDDCFSDKEWIYEEKFDGVRCITVKNKGKVELYSRNHKTMNHLFPELVADLEKKKSPDYVADGEIVAYEGKVTSFSKLQNRLGVLDTSRVKGPKAAVYFYLFDLLYWKDKILTDLPLLMRKKMLKDYFPFEGRIYYTPHLVGKGDQLFQKAKKKGWEGIIAKRGDSIYLSKRSRDWLKIKCSKSQEFVIGGYTDPQGSREGFGALLVGVYAGTKLLYAGKVGTGYDTELLRSLGNRLQKITTERCSFAEDPKEKNSHFVRPTLVCDVAFTEWTREGKLRHPRFKGLRTDKPAKKVRRE